MAIKKGVLIFITGVIFNEAMLMLQGVYGINNENVKMLSKFPIDKVGIMWTSGFETYDIYNVDLIMNHLSCLKKI